MELSVLTFSLVLVLAFANGTNDVSKAIATLVGSGVTNYRTAIAWGTLWTMIGAATAAFVATRWSRPSVAVSSSRLRHPVVPSSGNPKRSCSLGALCLENRTPGLYHACLDRLTRRGQPNGFRNRGLDLGYGLEKDRASFVAEPLSFIRRLLPCSPSSTLGCESMGRPLRLCPAKPSRPRHDRCTGVHPNLVSSRRPRRTNRVGCPSQCDRAGLSGPTLGLDSIHWLSSGLTSLARGTQRRAEDRRDAVTRKYSRLPGPVRLCNCSCLPGWRSPWESAVIGVGAASRKCLQNT